ncbi:MAG: hypothetical protein COX16_13090 [Deltaproteobacteria bacterium CG23_combo_of_CG06-09_8_20_14_all_51_20]|nr:MAG: hypothetical protein COX16_13090 [Deltaproteobacteria bacterium CG23_combo_of_CG06-09_8_20_14_all_51_20]
MDFDQSAAELGLKEAIKDITSGEKENPESDAFSTAPLNYRNMLLKLMKALSPTGYLETGVRDGRNSTALVAAQEELAAWSPPIFLSVETSSRMVGRLLALFGKGPECSTILDSLLNGQLIGSAAFSETNASFDQNASETRATLQDNGYIITGSKNWVAGASSADLVACLADSGGRPGVFIIRAGDKGFSTGTELTSNAIPGSVFNPVTLRDCLVPSDRAVIPDDKDFLNTVKLWEDQILTSLALGLSQRSYREALSHSKTHHSGGKPIIAYQEIGFKLAEMLTLLQSAQLLAYRAAWADETGNREAEVLARCAKVFCSEACERISTEALQVLGTKGVFEESLAASALRESKFLQIAGTSSERSRVKIGDNVLRDASF